MTVDQKKVSAYLTYRKLRKLVGYRRPGERQRDFEAEENRRRVRIEAAEALYPDFKETYDAQADD